jgi:hypothetical protein
MRKNMGMGLKTFIAARLFRVDQALAFYGCSRQTSRWPENWRHFHSNTLGIYYKPSAISWITF